MNNISNGTIAHNKVKSTRLRLGFTQQELMRTAGTSIATIVLIERYHYLPGEDVRERISQALEVPQNVLWPTLEAGEREGGNGNGYGK
jgi:transcriptional regulator with XRE-family HTH domain